MYVCVCVCCWHLPGVERGRNESGEGGGGVGPLHCGSHSAGTKHKQAHFFCLSTLSLSDIQTHLRIVPPILHPQQVPEDAGVCQGVFLSLSMKSFLLIPSTHTNTHTHPHTHIHTYSKSQKMGRGARVSQEVAAYRAREPATSSISLPSHTCTYTYTYTHQVDEDTRTHTHRKTPSPPTHTHTTHAHTPGGRRRWTLVATRVSKGAALAEAPSHHICHTVIHLYTKVYIHKYTYIYMYANTYIHI